MMQETLLRKTLFQQNLGQPRGLMVENTNICKTLRKKRQAKYIRKYSNCDFFKYNTLKVEEHIYADEQFYPIKQFILSLANSHPN